MEIKKVGVIGCGVMGAGIVQAVAVSGFDVIFAVRSEEKVERDFAVVRKSFAKAFDRKKISPEEHDMALDKITGCYRVDELGACDLVIETIAEDLDRKKELFGKLDELLPDDSIITTNTSSFSISELSAATSRPDRFAGLHFFVPAQAMKLVEVVQGEKTSEETTRLLVDFSKALGKEPVTVKDTPGFIVNSFLVPYLNQVIQAYDDGLASREDIDTAVKLGFGITLGPLAMLDLIGLDIQLHMARTLLEKTGHSRYKPPALLIRMVEEGRLGRKTGEGFYRYEK